MSTVLQATILLLTMANARAEEPATPQATGGAPEAPAAEEPPPDERVDGSDTIDVVEGVIAGRVLTALTAVALAADAVHRHRQHLVGLAGQGPETHAPGAETGTNALHTLHLIKR
jgi:hypothetical protein